MTHASPSRTETIAALLLTIVGLGLTTAFGLAAPEGIYHFDDVAHYLYARWAWNNPLFLLDDWGRPGFTALYFLPAAIGWSACRVLSAVLAAAAAWLAFRVAARMRVRYAWAVVPLAYAQPLFFRLSQTTLTEVPLAFYLILAVYLAQRGRWFWSAVFVSLATVTRHEAVIFLPIWLYFAHRDHVFVWQLLPPLIWAPLLVNVLTVCSGAPAPILKFFEPHPSTLYGCGSWLTFFARAMEAWGPAVAVLTMIGLSLTFASGRGGRLVAISVLAYFLTQTGIRALGLFDSGGYARFLVPICPLTAIAAHAGWLRLWSPDAGSRRIAAMLAASAMVVLWIAMERQLTLHAARLDQAAQIPGLLAAGIAVRVATAFVVVAAVSAAGFSAPLRSCLKTSGGPGLQSGRRRERVVLRQLPRQRRHDWRTILVPAVLAALIPLSCYALARPLKKPLEARLVEDCLAYLNEHGFANREIISGHPWFDYAIGRPQPPGRPVVRERWRRSPPGSLLAWDRQFTGSGCGMPIEHLLADPSLRLIHATPPAPFQHSPYLMVFEKLGTAQAAETS